MLLLNAIAHRAYDYGVWLISPNGDAWQVQDEGGDLHDLLRMLPPDTAEASHTPIQAHGHAYPMRLKLTPAGNGFDRLPQIHLATLARLFAQFVPTDTKGVIRDRLGMTAPLPDASTPGEPGSEPMPAPSRSMGSAERSAAPSCLTSVDRGSPGPRANKIHAEDLANR
jgi:hypothetical protein